MSINWQPDRRNADTWNIRKWWSLIAVLGTVVELRALRADRCGMVSGYFDFDHGDAFVAACLEYSWKAEAIYATANPAHRDLLARAANRARTWAKHTTADKDIVCRRWLPLDFDPVRPAGISATLEESAAAMDRVFEADAWLQELGFPDDSLVIADSGNGAHLPIRIELANDDDAKQLVNRCLAAVAHRFSDEVVKVDTTTGNAARIWKVPGTVAAKGDSIPERRHSMARLLSWSKNVIPVGREQLEKLAALAPTTEAARPARRRTATPANERNATPAATPPAHPEPRSRPARVGVGGGTTQGIDLRQWLADHDVPVRAEKPWNGGTLFEIDPCPWDENHDHGEAFAIQHADGAVSAHCHHNSCVGNGWDELKDVFDPGWRAQRAQSDDVNIPENAPPAIRRAFRRRTQRRY